ncbi:MAG TPA: NAD(P)H-quinone oxidoreductase [Acidimicrobiia bacterium]|nr:NAD(P)H-quinone oxidoreductase [Acidimicrobiia bacterium]
MRAAVVADGAVRVEEREIARPVADQVLVRVHGAGLNRADLLQRMGLYPPPPGAPADIPGLEFAGVVEEVGDGVHGLNPGDRVFGIVAGGGQAEYVLTLESHCARVPESVDLVEAGGVPEAYLTAHDALFTHAGVHPGLTVLVHAAGSGVGTAVTQLAACIGCRVIGTARTPEKLDRARELGLDEGVVATGDVEELIRAIENVGSPDVVIDLVGGGYFEVDVAVAAPRARIVLVGAIAGARATASILPIMNKRLHIMGTVLRSRPAHEKAAATHAFAGHVTPLLAAGTIGPVVEAVMPLDRVEDAYELLASDATFGKVILDCA